MIATQAPSAISALGKSEKAAMLLMSMGAEAAAQIFRNLNEHEIGELTAAMTRVSAIPHSERQAMLAEFLGLLKDDDPFHGGGLPYARTLLGKTLSEDKAAALLRRLETPASAETPFASLWAVETPALVRVLLQELPQTIALVLAHLPPKQAATVLSALPKDLQPQVVERCALMKEVSPLTLKRVEAALRRRCPPDKPRDKPQTLPAGGFKVTAEILNLSGGEVEKRIFNDLKHQNPSTVDELQKYMLTFDDLGKATDATMQMLLRELDLPTMALALKGGSEIMKEFVCRNLSERAKERLKEELEMLGSKKRSEIKAAQEQIVALARRLREEGKITLGQESANEDDELVE